MLLEKFEFIAPEQFSGFEPKQGAVRVVKKHQFSYINLGTIIGDAPKCMIALYEYEQEGSVRKSNKQTWKKYIAKSASKWYPNESITEHLLNELGRVFGLKMANSKIRRINNQIWFLSEYFIKEECSLYHGADLYGGYFDDKELVDFIQDDIKTDDQHYFTIQLVREVFELNFPNDAESIFSAFIRMVIFDGIIGNNDRHSYNWGVVTSVRPNESPCFAPVYDTARGLFWNSSEVRVKRLLNFPRTNGVNTEIEKYVVSSRPKIGWKGMQPMSHIELLKLIYDNETGISKQNFINFVSESNLTSCINVIEKEFKGLYSEQRKQLIIECLTLRFNAIRNFINEKNV